MIENYENLTLEQLKLYKASIEEYATISELLEVEKRIKESVINRFICTMFFVFGANLCSPCKKANYSG